MPDFTYEVFFHCTSAEHWATKVIGSTGKEYTVVYGHPGYGYHTHDYSCNCDAFKFNKNEYCKHIKEVQKSGKHCKWDQFIDGQTPIQKDGSYLCPKCGLEAIPLRYAV